MSETKVQHIVRSPGFRPTLRSDVRFLRGPSEDIVVVHDTASDRRFEMYAMECVIAKAMNGKRDISAIARAAKPHVPWATREQVEKVAIQIAGMGLLEDVAPDGRVTYVTEGQLRGVMRRVTDEPQLYKKPGPHRTELRTDAMPLVPGEVAEITFELWATSVLIKQGHRIRVAVSGADKDTFLRYPISGETPTLTIERNRHHTSRIQLPMKPR